MRATAPVLLALLAFGLLSPLVAPAGADPVKVFASPGPPLEAPEVVATIPKNHSLRGVGADGAGGVWFAENGEASDESYLVHYRPAQLGLARKLVKPTQQGYSEVIDGIAPAPDGSEWFARFYDNQVSHIDPTGRLKSKKLPAGSEPDSLAVGGDGTVWFAERGHGCHLGRLSTSGALSSRSIAFFANGVAGDCNEITVAPNNHAWVTTYSGEAVDDFSPDGTLLNVYPAGLSVGIASVGSKIWVTSIQPAAVTSISASGQEVEYQLPAGVTPSWSTAGPDGALWFYDYGPNGGAIGRLSDSGEFSEVPLPDSGSAVRLASSGGAIYFTMSYGGGSQALMRVWPWGNGPSDEASYVALGDSYSSGEGSPPYKAGTDLAGFDMCHRATESYPELLDGQLGLGPPSFAACSGARTNELFADNATNHETAQFNALKPGTTKTVTLTVGGDDAGFVEVLEHCVEGFRPRDHWVYWEGAECSKNQQLRELVGARLRVLADEADPKTLTNGPPVHPISEVLQQIHANAPLARIVIGGYPALFGKSKTTYSGISGAKEPVCYVADPYVASPYWVVYADAKWLNDEGAHLNSILQKAAVQARADGLPVTYAPPSGFKTHALCDSSAAWIHPLEISETNEVEPSSFHPTPTGQKLGYLPAFVKALK